MRVSVQTVESRRSSVTHSLLLQVVSHLLVFVFRQLLIAFLIVLSKDGLDLRIRVALPERKRAKALMKYEHFQRNIE